ncbi:MAG TPA: hypothetical protein VHX62_05625 [Solirubrobacteraceae bacterium]|jgi:hypothetical protein|nr:hypothetical protein [Solirubrobacteraceae bacterium]
MSRAGTVRAGPLALIAAGALALAGCGSGTSLLQSSSGQATRHGAVTHAGNPVSPGVPADAVRVIEGWANALRAGHVRAAARYFHIPSIFFGGSGPPVELHSLADAETANAGLPCGARFLAAKLEGHYVNVLFRLTDRPGPGGTSGCGSGAGETARTNFLIRGGLIVEWLRAPDEPGDNGTRTTPTTPTAPTPSPPPGATTGGGGTPLV